MAIRTEGEFPTPGRLKGCESDPGTGEPQPLEYVSGRVVSTSTFLLESWSRSSSSNSPSMGGRVQQLGMSPSQILNKQLQQWTKENFRGGGSCAENYQAGRAFTRDHYDEVTVDSISCPPHTRVNLPSGSFIHANKITTPSGRQVIATQLPSTLQMAKNMWEMIWGEEVTTVVNLARESDIKRAKDLQINDEYEKLRSTSEKELEEQLMPIHQQMDAIEKNARDRMARFSSSLPRCMPTTFNSQEKMQMEDLEKKRLAIEAPYQEKKEEFFNRLYNINIGINPEVPNQYWPNPETPLEASGGLSVRQLQAGEEGFIEIPGYDHFQLFELKGLGIELLQFQLEKSGEEKIVRMVRFKEWPDHRGALAKRVIELRNFVNAVNSTFGEKVYELDHCLAGVGRTGAYITVKEMLDQIDRAKDGNATHPTSEDLLAVVKKMRSDRDVQMVQTEEQLACALECMNSYTQL